MQAAGDIDFSRRRKSPKKGSPAPRQGEDPNGLSTHIAVATNPEMALKYGHNFCIIQPLGTPAEELMRICERFHEACCAGTTTYRCEKTADQTGDGMPKAPQIVHTVGTQAQLGLARIAASEIFGKTLNPTRNAQDVPQQRTLQVTMAAGNLSVKGDTLTIKDAMWSIGPEGPDAVGLWKWDAGTSASIAVPTEAWPYARIRSQLTRLLSITGFVIEDWYASLPNTQQLALLTLRPPLHVPAERISSGKTRNFSKNLATYLLKYSAKQNILKILLQDSGSTAMLLPMQVARTDTLVPDAALQWLSRTGYARHVKGTGWTVWGKPEMQARGQAHVHGLFWLAN